MHYDSLRSSVNCGPCERRCLSIRTANLKSNDYNRRSMNSTLRLSLILKLTLLIFSTNPIETLEFFQQQQQQQQQQPFHRSNVQYGPSSSYSNHLQFNNQTNLIRVGIIIAKQSEQKEFYQTLLRYVIKYFNNYYHHHNYQSSSSTLINSNGVNSNQQPSTESLMMKLIPIINHIDNDDPFQVIQELCLQLNRGIMAFIIPPSGLFNSYRAIASYSSVFKLPLISTSSMIPSSTSTSSSYSLINNKENVLFQSKLSKSSSKLLHSNDERDHIYQQHQQSNNRYNRQYHHDHYSTNQINKDDDRTDSHIDNDNDDDDEHYTFHLYPDFIRPLVETIKHYRWPNIIYLYNTDNGEYGIFSFSLIISLIYFYIYFITSFF